MIESLDQIRQEVRAARRDFKAAERALSADTVTQPGSPERAALVLPLIDAYNRALDARNKLERARRALRQANRAARNGANGRV